MANQSEPMEPSSEHDDALTNESRMLARALGQQYSDWDREQLVQSASYANDVLPEIRRLAGYKDSGTGTYWVGPDDPDEMEALYWRADDLLDIFWEGYDGRA